MVEKLSQESLHEICNRMIQHNDMVCLSSCLYWKSFLFVEACVKVIEFIWTNSSHLRFFSEKSVHFYHSIIKIDTLLDLIGFFMVSD